MSKYKPIEVQPGDTIYPTHSASPGGTWKVIRLLEDGRAVIYALDSLHRQTRRTKLHYWARA